MTDSGQGGDTEQQVRATQFHERPGLGGWRVLGDGVCTFFRTGSFTAGARLVAAIAEIDGIDDHSPDVDLRRDGVTVRLITMNERMAGLTVRDADTARTITEVAARLGVTPDPTVAQSVLIIPGAPDTASIMPFWEAVLGYRRRPDTPDEDLVDPRDRGPAFWFESMREPRSDGGGSIHVAVWLAAEEAEARVAAALAAGGHVVREGAPSWWTLADSAGNEADVATIQGRD